MPNPAGASTFLDATSLFSPVDTNEIVVANEADQHKTLGITPISSHDADSDRLSSHPGNSNANNEEEPTAAISGPHLEEGTSAGCSRVWNGFKLVGNNINKNYHQSFHRIKKKRQL